MKDPYLIPGAICEVWNARPQYIDTAYFWKYDRNGVPVFVESYYRGELDVHNILSSYSNYRVLNTEWTFAPDWALCSTVDQDGRITLWSLVKVVPVSSYWNNTEGPFNAIHCGTCPDKTSYDGDAWKTSLRMRPKWAKKVLEKSD